MRDEDCVRFLKWCLPQLGLRWPEYRKVRRQVGKRLKRRLAELGLADLCAYRGFLLAEPKEWAQLETMCHIPISRFYRDRGVFDAIGRSLLPEAAAAALDRGDDAIRCWSAGCAAGEEPYTLAMAWQFGVARDWPMLGLTVIATDADETMIGRAKPACYGRSSLKDLPENWLARAFAQSGPLYCLLPEFRRDVRFELQDIRNEMPEGPFDLILCRNLAFTYFEEALQLRILDGLRGRLAPRGFLVLGIHEALPPGAGGLARLSGALPIYRRDPQAA